MRDKDVLNLYGWWPSGHSPQITIISMAGFDELPPEGRQTDQALANVLATCLAGYYGDLDAHARGAKDCPMSFNANRSLKHLVEPQTFDETCRKKLQKPLGTKLSALEALLKVFH
jgi:hypothetical protein